MDFAARPAPRRLRRLRIANFRALASVELELEPVNVIFGPCGVGKSSLLDAPWFVRDCLREGVDHAAARRDHGIGMLWDGADEGATITIELATDELAYALELGLGAGRIEAYPGERLVSLGANAPVTLLERRMGAESLGHALGDDGRPLPPLALREPNRPGLARYVDRVPQPAVEVFVEQLSNVSAYSSRAFQLQALKRKGSETAPGTTLEPHARNLWSVLRNLKDRRSRDPRYDTICGFMRQAFPEGFIDLEFEQTAPTVVYASMIEHGRRQPINASGISDGHLQMLVILTAIFGDDLESPGLLLLDEPEISLHPWPLAVMAHALRTAAREPGRQVVLATHSPVMISQFESHELLVAERVDGHMSIRRLAEIADVQDLLEQFAAGSIYMAQGLAPQGGRPQYLPESGR